jgi:class 3 adenylate cyclase
VQELPSGTVTFLFTDVEGSTRLMQKLGDRWPDVHREHRRILREAFAASGGREVDTQGDAFFVAFARARDGVNAAAAGQEAIRAQEWPDGADIRVRMGLHTGEPAVGEEGYLGIDVVRAARLCAAAHGGQVLLSETTRALLRGDEPDGVELRDLGEHHLKDMRHPERVYQLVAPGLGDRFPALRTLDAPAARAPRLPMPVEGRADELAERLESVAFDLRDAVLTQVEQALRPRVQAGDERARRALERAREKELARRPRGRTGKRRELPPVPPPPSRSASSSTLPGLIFAGVMAVLFFATVIAVVYLLTR